ncbi:MAG: FAD-dependent oxidoreductase [Bacillota bacterium]|nr:FAD-dependent oxidoreductase [Bacillota bacterium]
MKVVIVGGVAGGASAAARLRRLDEKAEIIILERSGFISYANCGLPYYIGEVITDKNALTLQTPQSFQDRFRVDVRVRNEVTSIDTKNKTVLVTRLEDGSSYTQSYDRLILSPGAKPIRPNIPGINNNNILSIRTVEDTLKIHTYIKTIHPKKAVIVGGGFIGLEMAENLTVLGIETVLLEGSNQLLPPLDYDMACEVHAYLRNNGIQLKLNSLVTGFYEKNGKIFTELKDGNSVSSDFIILAIGVAPDTQLAQDAGLTLGSKNAISVNEHMQTSDPNIYAVGDAVEVSHFVSGQKALIALAGPANKQGRIAANNICGIESSFKGSQGTSVVKLFDMTVASTGLNEKQLQSLGIDYDKVLNFSLSHATYYPGARNLTIKTLFSPTDGEILGAQIVGFGGVDKRIDVLATAIRGGMTSSDLEELELAYAPPFSSAKDPVNMVGFTIENIRGGLVKQYHWHDIENLQKDSSALFLDVRTDVEYAKGSIPNTLHIPLHKLRNRLNELDPNKKIYVNCQSGLRSYIACRILSQNGFECFNLSGGYRFYEVIRGENKYNYSPAYACGVEIIKK